MRAVLRPRLRLVVAVWLAVHLAAGVSIARAAITDDCTCPAGMTPGQTCPMHHAPASTARCRLVNAPGNSSVFVSIVVPAALRAETAVHSNALVPLSVIASPSAALISQSDNPDAPPPRQI